MQTSQEQIGTSSILENSSSGIKMPSNKELLNGNSHKIKNLSERVITAFVKVEQDNDEMLSRMKNSRINQIVSTMLEVEKSNDTKIKEMIGTLAAYELNRPILQAYYLNGWSSEMVAQLR
jgi:hypothetical protein